MTATMTLEEVQTRIEGLPEDQQQKIVCALVGHSNIEDTFWGYWHCGRCEAQVGDSLGGAYFNSRRVLMGHNCETCRENYEMLSWRDTFMAPDPFTGEDSQ